MWSALGKYKSIVVSIALFLLLDASVLILNFYISFTISDDAVGVNLAGRQRMLSQRTVKSLYEIESAEFGSDLHKKALSELALSYSLFDSTLSAFDKGGSAKGADGNQVTLNIVDSAVGRNAIEEAKELWAPYSVAIRNVIEAEAPDDVDRYLQEATRYAVASNLTLLKLMNQLTVDLEKIATGKAQTLRYIQTAGISLAIINFFIIIFHFIGELRSNDRKLEEARKETSEILDTVNEGLFLLDSQQQIGTQHSACLPALFGRQQVAGMKFSELIKDLVKPKDLDTAQRFIALLFRPDVKSNLIHDLNPLNEVELQIPLVNGGYETRYLRFDFKRVVSDDENVVLVTVNDITSRVVLAAELAHEKIRNEQQMEMLTSILHTDSSVLHDFINTAFSTFERINQTLKHKSKSHESLKRKLDQIFIEVHGFKGDASALGLDSFADHAHRFENQIKALQDLAAITGNDFLSLVVHLEGLIRYTEDIHEISNKLAKFARDDNSQEPTRAGTSPGNNWDKLKHLAESVAKRENKDAYVVLSGLHESSVGPDTESLINDLCIQFVRNSIVHSIEESHHRIAIKKDRRGRIDVQLVTLPTGEVELSVADDGAGLDYDKIRRKAIALGKWDSEQVSQWDRRKLLSLIFEPGFSTADQISQDAGQGIGMSLIRQRLSQAGGRLKVSNRSGLSCKFVVTIPAQAANEMAA